MAVLDTGKFPKPIHTCAYSLVVESEVSNLLARVRFPVGAKSLTESFKTVHAPVAQLVERRAYRNWSIQMPRESRGFNPRREQKGLVISFQK